MDKYFSKIYNPLEYTGLDIIKIRKKYNWSQEDLAIRIGSSYKTILNYEKSGIVTRTKWAILDKVVAEEEARRLKLDKPTILSEAEEVPIHDVETLEITKRISGTEFAELSDGSQLMLMPMVEPYAYAGYLNGFTDEKFIDELPKHAITVEKKHFGIYRSFRVRGDSMDNDRKDAYCNGDIVAGRQIDKKYWNSKFHLHKFEDYVIIHQDGIVIKRIIAHDVEKGIITCHSLNPDKTNFADYDLSLSEVHEIYNIVSFERKKG